MLKTTISKPVHVQYKHYLYGKIGKIEKKAMRWNMCVSKSCLSVSVWAAEVSLLLVKDTGWHERVLCVCVCVCVCVTAEGLLMTWTVNTVQSSSPSLRLWVTGSREIRADSQKTLCCGGRRREDSLDYHSHTYTPRLLSCVLWLVKEVLSVTW